MMTGCFPPLQISQCYCDCHNGLIINPKCYCTCNTFKSNTIGETLAICKHGLPVKFGCGQCTADLTREPEKDKMIPLDVLPILKRIDALEAKIKILSESACYADERIKELTISGNKTRWQQSCEQDMGSLRDLIIHAQRRIEKCFERIESHEKWLEGSRISINLREEEFCRLEQKYDHCQDGIDKCFEKVEEEIFVRRTELDEALRLYKKLEKSSDERAHLINYKSYLDLADKITELETLIHDESHDRGNIWSRLEYLENFQQSIVSAPHPRLLNERLKKLEERLKKLEEN